MSDAQIFQVFSLVYLAVGLGILVNPGFYKKVFEGFIEDACALYFGGVAALVAGYLILTLKGMWASDWSVIISIVGWLALVKGLVILIRPEIIITMSSKMIKSDRFLKIEAIVVIALGLALSFLGFCPESPV